MEEEEWEGVCEIFRISKTTLSLALITRYQRDIYLDLHTTFVVHYYVEEALIFNVYTSLVWMKKKIWSPPWIDLSSPIFLSTMLQDIL